MTYPRQWSAVGTTNQGQNEPYLRHSIENPKPFIGGLKPAAIKWIIATRLVLCYMKACTMLLDMVFSVFPRTDRLCGRPGFWKIRECLQTLARLNTPYPSCPESNFGPSPKTPGWDKRSCLSQTRQGQMQRD
ncbi:hypothetical protein [Haliscomenobacter hydrossis]|nr:hypothetical protein [Haliscomenobacter hydrossis]